MHPARSVKALLLGAAIALPSTATTVDAGANTHETPIVVRVDEHGFRWTDAAIGCAAGIGASLATVGGLALVRPQRPSLREKGGRT